MNVSDEDRRVAVVTGGAGAIGGAIAARLARDHTVVVLDRTGGDVVVDLGDPDDVRRAAALVVDRYGGCDVLVHAAAMVAFGPLEDVELDVWRAVQAVNVESALLLTQAFAPRMRARGFGRVIFIGTVGSLRPGSRTPHYYAAKAALPNLAVGLAKELSGSGITVNTVSPGIIATAEVRESFRRRAAKRGWTGDEVELERRAVAEFMANPSARAGRVEEVGALVAFLASRHAGYINGANLRIDGGAADAAV